MQSDTETSGKSVRLKLVPLYKQTKPQVTVFYFFPMVLPPSMPTRSTHVLTFAPENTTMSFTAQLQIFSFFYF